MLFNSFEFIFIFLPISFFVYFYLNHKRLTIASKSWLVFSSLFFYSWWNIAYLPLILISILFNYTITNSIIEYNESNKKYFSKKALLQIGLVFNVGLLAYFKYMDFFIENINTVFSSHIELLHLALPLAISFFTLQQIAFLVDSYEGLVKEKNFLDYTIFVTFFPQLIAGPIVHHKEMMPQFSSLKNKVKNYRNITLGFFIFSIGLFKKVVIADTFAQWANYGFDKTEVLHFLDAWITSLSYTFQMYFDFSGYMDMAIGAALLFNIKLPQNFNSPYKATGMIDYWKRWHITLTNFITTYIYTPIIKSFSRLTFNKAMLATIVVFLISGLWHGASWMFVLWGLLHGIGVVINHYWHKTKIKMNKVLAWFITFNFINITFVIFRAKEWDDAQKVFVGMGEIIIIPFFTFMKQIVADNTWHLNSKFLNLIIHQETAIINIRYSEIFILTLLLFAFIIVLSKKNSHEMLKEFKPSILSGIFIVMIFFYSFIASAYWGYDVEFLYFNF